ncbi:hypothetical protein JG687_00015268 [Phytophthora cactorum]|uniref:Uncharacterized protein n=1 Tax=Phytophthora cactorum TaxID=29920 RepID=A0A329RGY2_9STRA|nr:hypothetical protein Pcac1_g22272 [Phytophthora cactorum]KAG2801391.1 hypothetical protein PC112_g20064 [Phytophthora cactorum]KAG2801970.1 hypothetical protein PC111_g19310 [Phytophthora cactorum]KAG2836892.1 hypothetical protein PC113_g19946 [Phytophthora cactorum]KAG2880726.1 hypothetical protein PC114_g21931 [Phytophthora cactorum]
MNQVPYGMEHERTAAQHHETKGQPIEMNFEAHEPSPTSTPSDRDNDPNKQAAKVNTNAKTTSYQKQSASPDADGDQHNHRAFSTYTFSKSAILDDEGRQVASMQGSYEDSTGRQKAVHERQIEGTKLRTTWSSMDGQHETTCSSGTPEEFEAEWQQTPFGEAQKAIQEQQKQQEQLKRSGLTQKLQQQVANSKAKMEATSMEK